MSRPFLTARWSNLFLATYTVPPALLARRLPPGLELDTLDGQAFVSLVAFDFIDTRVWGVPWPGFRNFPELNLRFYVRAGEDRGVIFIREFVSSRLVSWLARILYHEPYRAAPLSSSTGENIETRTAAYRLSFAGRVHSLVVTGKKPPYCPPKDSLEHFLKEHRWGYGNSSLGNTERFEVVHPVWDILPVTSYRVDLDWELAYGPEWAFLTGAKPMSTIFALGSEVAVFPKDASWPAPAVHDADQSVT
jgi:uncharacterized protein YqjF (DUF2071 family)